MGLQTTRVHPALGRRGRDGCATGGSDVAGVFATGGEGTRSATLPVGASARSTIDAPRRSRRSASVAPRTAVCIGWVQDGRVRLIEGNPKDPNSQGTICSKANGLIEATEYSRAPAPSAAAHRPRGSGDWERISWDEALDEVADRLRRCARRALPSSSSSTTAATRPRASASASPTPSARPTD